MVVARSRTNATHTGFAMQARRQLIFDEAVTADDMVRAGYFGLMELEPITCTKLLLGKSTAGNRGRVNYK